MIVSIHQPNFVPWYPYFQKMLAVDKFIILSHCQFSKNGHQNRFMIDDKWCTMSVKKGMRPITEKLYSDPHADWSKIKNKLPEYCEILDQFDDCIGRSLQQTNVAIIKRLAEMLNIKTEIVFDYPTDLKSTPRLVDLCEKYGASKYLAGASGKSYLDLELFHNKNIDVSFQENATPKHVLEILKNGI